MTAGILFSHPLQPAAPIDAANWFVRWSNTERTVLAALAGPLTVTLATAIGGADVGPDVVSYSPPPFDVISDTTIPTAAPAFTDFPLVL